MKIIVAQKHMNLASLIVVTFSAIGLISCGNKPSKLVAAPQLGNSGRTFADWCRQKADLSPEAKHTVEELLKIAGTTECDAADRKLSSLPGLGLIDDHKISDIKPLESLTNLTVLILIGNKISDIKPLESLTNLKHLVLSNNQISDIKPLESLTNLKELGLNNNQISDIKPLESLTNLTVLNLDSNQIRDIKPLQSLTKLTRLHIRGNPIAPKTCPLKPESICKWEPQPKS
ncbi:leucine-rich repeat-containing protein [Oscillatoria nigro-viridis PCC 7112]|uniref:Leucine-rich repeat-containing protein n=2 Tax=Phormidium nigroviride TaxID=482564 RepID=K9VSP8_9CYAN|nr:leucine-rich repeat-containing protein [Oscillatoria nigro-viridis PCC 7112]